MASGLKTKINSSNSSSFLSLIKSAKLFADYYEEGLYYYNVYGTIDVYDFIEKLSNNYTFNPGTAYLNEVKKAFNKLVPHCSVGGGAGNANGLSMFYALHSYCDKFTYYSADDTPLQNWQSIVATYGK